MPFPIQDVVNDPDFAQAFTITRSQGGKWELGRWQNATVDLPQWGAVQQPETKDLEQVPEGDRLLGVIVIHNEQEMYVTNSDGTGKISDIVTWHNDQYRLISVSDRSDYGYFKAIAVRMAGQ
jgi:hypothetical protein